MATMAVALPCVPDGDEKARQLAAECSGPRRAEWEDFHRRVGVTSERWFLQQTPQGPLVILVLEGDPMGALQKLAASDEPFDRWFKEESRAIHGVDWNNPLPGPPPTLILEG